MTELVASLVGRYFSACGGELKVGGVPISAIVARYGTPLYLYDARVLDEKWRLLREALPSEFGVYYSVKANPNPTILRYLVAKGCGLEVASGGELHQALHAGCAPEEILFAGPGKTDQELELGLKHRIGEFHAESLFEVQRIAAVGRRVGLRAAVAVRVNPSAEVQGGAMRMGGHSAPFGIDEEALDAVLDVLLATDGVDFQGIHLFTGTQILDPAVLVTQYRKGIDIAEGITRKLGRPLPTVDLGGGLGIPYFATDRPLDMAQLQQDLAVLMANVRSSPFFSGTRFIVEPGRYLVGEAGIYVARVTDIKLSRGRKFLILDGGLNHHLAASGNLGQVIKRNFPIGLLNKLDRSVTETVNVVGPLCTPLDILARAAQLPSADVGDLVGVFQSGAYARSASPLGFLSHPTPAEALVHGGSVHLIRRRGTYDDLFQDLVEPPDATALWQHP